MSNPGEGPFKFSAILFRVEHEIHKPVTADLRGLLEISRGTVTWQVEHAQGNPAKQKAMSEFGMTPAGRFDLFHTMLPNGNFKRYLCFIMRRGNVILVRTVDNAGSSAAKKVLDPDRLHKSGRGWWFFVTEKLANDQFRQVPMSERWSFF
jgi:hypothetical protein